MNKRRKFFSWLKWILIICAGGGIALYYLQDKLVLHPTSLAKEYAFQFSQPYKEVFIPYDSSVSFHLVQFTVPDSLRKGVVLYFHGNRENINRYAKYAAFFTQRHYEVWMCDYPSFGKTKGNFTEPLVYEQALQIYKLARQSFATDSIILYGKSLGTGIASQLASIRDCRNLILETPYRSIHEVARHFFWMYPVSRMMQYEFPVEKYITLVDAPVTIFHGTDDGVIPYKQAMHLSKLQATKSIELITLEKGNHLNLNEFPLMQKKLHELLTAAPDTSITPL